MRCALSEPGCTHRQTAADRLARNRAELVIRLWSKSPVPLRKGSHRALTLCGRGTAGQTRGRQSQRGASAPWLCMLNIYDTETSKPNQFVRQVVQRQGRLAEWSKALASGSFSSLDEKLVPASLHGRGFESHSDQFFLPLWTLLIDNLTFVLDSRTGLRT